MDGTPRAGAPSVIVVDDSQDVRAVVRRVLETAGFEVVAEGGDGDEAIVLSFLHEPDLLLLDTSMPKVDGIEALPAVLAVSPRTSVVMFTGFEEPGLAARARELGAADLVQKSTPMEELPARLRRALGVPRSRDPSTTTPAEAVDTGEEQAVLTEHVQQFRELFDRAEIGMATLTSSGSIVRANPALATLMSCEPEDLVGVDYGRLSEGHGDELDRRLEDICSLGEDLTTFEHQLPAPLGEELPRTARATLAPIRDSRGQVLYVFAQVQDITAQRAVESDLRRSEDNFRRLVTAVAEYAIFLLSVNGTVVSWNAGAERIKGYRAEEIIGRPFRIFYPPEEQEVGHPAHNLALALRHGSFAEEGWRVRKDGSRFWASVVITPVYDDDGRHLGFAKVTRDQTKQRDHEEERRRFIEQRIHLLAMTAHELRTPTAVIDGSAGILQSWGRHLSVPSRRELMSAIRSSADRLRRLAADLSAASRSDAETLPLHAGPVSLTEVLQTAVVRVRAAGGDVTIEPEVPHEAVFEADAGRLAQALDNLLDNAMHHGQPPICLMGTANGDVCIRVTDQGPGIPEELVPHLFERFAVAGSGAGSGLGLYLVREIARRHGGDVTYHPPTAGEPTTFEITLPKQGVDLRAGSSV